MCFDLDVGLGKANRQVNSGLRFCQMEEMKEVQGKELRVLKGNGWNSGLVLPTRLKISCE